MTPNDHWWGFPVLEKDHELKPFSFSSGGEVGTQWGVSLGFGGSTIRKDLCDLQKSLPS
jgi:hypothetical protein